jgi:transcriptional regulator with XRE-family HTH domain
MKGHRSKMGLSQAELAEKAELSPGYVAELELGRKYPSPEVLEKLSAALELRPYRLLMDEEDETEDKAMTDVRAFARRLAELIVSELPSILEAHEGRGVSGNLDAGGTGKRRGGGSPG